MRTNASTIAIAVVVACVIILTMAMCMRTDVTSEFFATGGKATGAIIQADRIHKDPKSTVEQEVSRFIPTNISECKDLLPGVSRNFALLWPENIRRKYLDFAKAVLQQKFVEGHSGQLPEQILAYIHLVRLPFVKTVCETGFNAGHSTFTWLASNPEVHVYSFDIGYHAYAKPQAELLSGMFPGRLTVTWGNSAQTLPFFRKSNPDVRCDVIVVDGGHTPEIAQADMANFRLMANTNNLVVLDDYPTQYYGSLGIAWKKLTDSGVLKTIFNCGFAGGKWRAFSVGQFLV